MTVRTQLAALGAATVVSICVLAPAVGATAAPSAPSTLAMDTVADARMTDAKASAIDVRPTMVNEKTGQCGPRKIRVFDPFAGSYVWKSETVCWRELW